MKTIFQVKCLRSEFRRVYCVHTRTQHAIFCHILDSMKEYIYIYIALVKEDLTVVQFHRYLWVGV